MRTLLLTIALLLTGMAGIQAQDKPGQKTDTIDTLPYLKYPRLPAFNILLTDSSTIFNTYNIPKGRPVMLMLFDPDCSHCKDEMKALLRGMDSLKDVRIYLVTTVHSISAIKQFYNDFHLADYQQIEAIGRDYEFFFVTYYGAKFVPDIVLYDENKQLIQLYERHATVANLYNSLHPQH